MKNLIYKYSLTDQQWCDNRNYDEFKKEVISADNEKLLRGDVLVSHSSKILNGKIIECNTSLYALSKSAIEEYIKEKK